MQTLDIGGAQIAYTTKAKAMPCLVHGFAASVAENWEAAAGSRF